MSLEVTLIILTLVIAAINMIMGLVRTYYAKYAKKTYVGSADYWASWQKRKYDVAAQVLKEMGLDSPADLRKIIRTIKKSKSKSKVRD